MKMIIIYILVVTLTCVTLTSCLENFINKEEKEDVKEKTEKNIENKIFEKERVADEIEALYRAESEDGYGIFNGYVIDSKGYSIFAFDEGEECILFKELSDWYSIPRCRR